MMAAQMNHVLVKAATAGDMEDAENALQQGADACWNSSEALTCAAANGHIDVVQLLLPLSDPKANDSFALVRAAANGHIEVVQLLLPLSDPKARESCALWWAACLGDLPMAILLLPHSDVANNAKIMSVAAEHGHKEMVQLLLEAGADPTADDSVALAMAMICNRLDIIDVLFSVSDAPSVLRNGKNENRIGAGIDHLLQKIQEQQAAQEKNTLLTHTQQQVGRKTRIGFKKL